MILFAILLAAASGSILGWFINHEQIRSKSRDLISDLEGKLRYANGQAAGFKEKMAVMRGEVVSLEKNIKEERLSRVEQITHLTDSFKKGAMALTVIYLGIGLTVGGVATWMTASSKAEAVFSQRHVDLIVEAQQSKEKAVILQEENDVLQTKLESIQKDLFETRVDREVVRTKLRILLASLSPMAGGQGFSVNYDKFKKNVEKHADHSLVMSEVYPSAPPAAAA